MPKHELTIIVPVYNEEENLPKLREQLNQFLDKSVVEAKILFVNDGSSDGSAAMLEAFCKENPHYHYISLAKNNGLSTAIKAGIDECDTPYLGYMDSDLQTSPMDFIECFHFLKDYDMVNGIRVNRNDSLVKKISSSIANHVRRYLINDGIQDTCCPLKLIKTVNAKHMPFFNGMHRFMPALVQLQGGKVKQVPVKHFPRYAGTAKYHLSNRIIKPFIDTLVFMWMRKSYINYHILKKN